MKRFKVYYEFNGKKMYSVIESEVESDTEEEAKSAVLSKIKFIKVEELMTEEEMKAAHKAVDALKESLDLMEKSKDVIQTDLDAGIDLQIEGLNKMKEAKKIVDSL